MIQIDNSIISQFVSCPAAAIAQYRENRTGAENPYSAAGSAGHDALECHFNGGSVEECMDVMRKRYASEAETISVEVPEIASIKRLEMIMEDYLLNHPIESYPFEVISTERALTYKLTDDIEYTVKQDALVRMKTSGMVMPLDHKFRCGSMTEWWLSKFASTSQFTGYIWACREEGHNTAAIWVNAIGLNLPKSVFSEKPINCRTHGMPWTECWPNHVEHQMVSYGRTDEEIENWKRDVISLAYQYEALRSVDLQVVPKWGKFNNQCTFCQVRAWCDFNFDPYVMDETTIQKHWKPWEE